MQFTANKSLSFLFVNCAAFIVSLLSASAHAASENSICFDSCTADYLICVQAFPETDCAAQRDICTRLCGLKSEQQFGAIAYSVSTRKHGFSNQYATRVLAEQRALQECSVYSQGNDCRIVSWTAGWCGALAVSFDGAWGAADGISEPLAQSAAIAQCQLYTSTPCVVETSICSK